MKRVAIFAHFDAENEIKPYVAHHLEKLRETCTRVVFASTAQLEDRQLDGLCPPEDRIIMSENSGWDFGMWKQAMSKIGFADADQLVLTNSSVFGPIFPLEPVFAKMEEDPCDFWGMTDNFEWRWHLQSYFIVFKPQVFNSEAFRLFWNSVLPYRSKEPVVMSYELGLTSFLVDSGFRPGAFLPTEAWTTWSDRRRMDLARRWNPTLFHPMPLISRGMPYVKVSLLRDNLGEVRLDPVFRAMADAGYDLDLVKFDRPAPQRDRALKARARRLWTRVAEYSEGSSQLPVCRPPLAASR
jgi:lipopolysaccharide biosynthesis protein